jgi:hypothetical protein
VMVRGGVCGVVLAYGIAIQLAQALQRDRPGSAPACWLRIYFVAFTVVDAALRCRWP